MVMSLGAVVGDLFASCEVGDLLASADRRDKGGMARFTGKRRGKMAEAAFVAKVVPENAWYVFPVRALRGMRFLKLFPGSRKRRWKFEKYREAWDICGGEVGKDSARTELA